MRLGDVKGTPASRLEAVEFDIGSKNGRGIVTRSEANDEMVTTKKCSDALLLSDE